MNEFLKLLWATAIYYFTIRISEVVAYASFDCVKIPTWVRGFHVNEVMSESC